jgi:hypothetical protein
VVDLMGVVEKDKDFEVMNLMVVEEKDKDFEVVVIMEELMVMEEKDKDFVVVIMEELMVVEEKDKDFVEVDLMVVTHNYKEYLYNVRTHKIYSTKDLLRYILNYLMGHLETHIMCRNNYLRLSHHNNWEL